jgi:hypothetical protein
MQDRPIKRGSVPVAVRYCRGISGTCPVGVGTDPAQNLSPLYRSNMLATCPHERLPQPMIPPVSRCSAGYCELPGSGGNLVTNGTATG